MDRLRGRVVLISGGARGQGESHGRILAQEGAKVVIGDVRDELGREAAAAMQADGLEVEYIHLDVRNYESWEAAVAFAKQRFGKLDGLVNNAGIVGSMAGVVEETDEAWANTIAVNQTGVWYGMKAAIPAMREAGGGSIVNTSSIWGVVGAETYIAYQASKGAVQLMTKSAALTYVREGIRVNSILPGLVLTPLAEEEGEESNNAVIRMTPMARGAQASEISWGVVYLLSDEASYVTGTELAIDGGFLAQ
jgi:NAD(P)-dependent dehydrogenase (short-subunit alcohol dehydrogenase family)